MKHDEFRQECKIFIGSFSSNDKLEPQTLGRTDTKQTRREVFPGFPNKLPGKMMRA